MLWKLAYLNLWRNRRRTLLAGLSIMFGVVVIVCTGNFINGMRRQWATAEINSNTGALQIEHRDYQLRNKLAPLEVSVEPSTEWVRQIREIPGVRSAYGKLKFTGLVSGGRTSTFFDGVAVDVRGQRESLPQQEDLIVAGKPLDQTAGGVVLGSDLADMLGIRIGDPVMILVRTYQGGMNMNYGTLVGTKNGRHFPSSTYLETTLMDAQKLLRMGDRVSQVVVRARDFDSILALSQQIEKLFSSGKVPFTVRNYAELIPNYARGTASFKAISMVLGLVLFILVGSGVGNVMAMAVLERRREIGTLCALGMEKGQVRRLYLAEGFLVSLFGALAGLVSALLLSHLVASHGGLPLPPPPGTSQKISIIPLLDPFMAGLGVIVPVIVSLFATWWPASTSANLHPAEALREA
jgi:putative ABC transport system permease protein